MTSPAARAAILVRVAAAATIAARQSWRVAVAHPSEATVRDALRRCVLAARTAHRAALANSGDAARELEDDARRLEAAAVELKHKLAAA